MALLFADGFDHYTSGSQKWDFVSGGSFSTNFGRLGSVGLELGGNQAWGKLLGTNASTLVAGTNFKTTRIDSGQPQGILGFYDNGSNQCNVTLNAGSMFLEVRRGSTVIATSGFKNLRYGYNYYIEFKADISSSGSYEVRVNGETWISGSGANLQSTANAYANRLYINSPVVGVTVNCDYDDVYVCDTTGAQNNNFLGDVVVQALYPNGNGNYGALSRGGTDSGTNWGQVDESPPNSDTDYVFSANVGDKDTYAMTNLSNSTGTVKALQLLYFARKDDAGTRTVKGKIRSNVTDSDGANTNLSTSYIYYRDIFELNPDTSTAWTPTTINAVECGVEIVA